jgi:hypothetical protein
MIARKMNKYLSKEIEKIILTDVFKAQVMNFKGLVGSNTAEGGKMSSFSYSSSS